MSLDRIENMIDDIIKKCVNIKKYGIEDLYGIDFVLLSGGSSLIPAV